MFRCPTCISVLGDPTSRRCTQCGQRLRRKNPRVLGEENRPGAKMLPIERAMHDRLHGHAAKGRRSSFHQPPPWMERYQLTAHAAASVAVAHGDQLRGGGGVDTMEPPRPAARHAAPPAPPMPTTPPEFEFEPEHSALDIESYLANFEPPAATTIAPAPDTIVRDDEPETFEAFDTSGFQLDNEPEIHVDVFAPLLADPEPEAEFALDPGPLDPEVQALVDDLYKKARAEIVGTFESPVIIDPVVEMNDALIAAPESIDERPPSGPRRRGWVPAVLADRKKNENGNGKAGGWRRLD